MYFFSLEKQRTAIPCSIFKACVFSSLMSLGSIKRNLVVFKGIFFFLVFLVQIDFYSDD